ncbi:MAG: hypothetical protein ACI8X5_000818 [Planctomycetota bacterium]
MVLGRGYWTELGWTAPLASQIYVFWFGGFWPGGVDYGLIGLVWLQLKGNWELELAGASQKSSTGGSGVCGGFELAASF